MLGRKVQHSGVGCLVDGQWRNVNITAAKTAGYYHLGGGMGFGE